MRLHRKLRIDERNKFMNYELKKVLELINGAVVLSVNGERKGFASGREAAGQLVK